MILQVFKLSLRCIWKVLSARGCHISAAERRP